MSRIYDRASGSETMWDPFSRGAYNLQSISATKNNGLVYETNHVLLESNATINSH